MLDLTRDKILDGLVLRWSYEFAVHNDRSPQYVTHVILPVLTDGVISSS